MKKLIVIACLALGFSGCTVREATEPTYKETVSKAEVLPSPVQEEVKAEGFPNGLQAADVANEAPAPSPTVTVVSEPEPEAKCFSVMITKVGGCNSEGSCGTILRDGSYMEVTLPVEGATVEKCE